jgi:hypothetical protein
MSGWVRLDDDFYDHEKFVSLTPEAVGVWTIGLAWSCRNLTDGFIPAGKAWSLVNPVDLNLPGVIESLTETRLWDSVEGGYRIHNFLRYQRASGHVEAAKMAYRSQRVLAGQARAAGADRTSGRFVKVQVTPATASASPASRPAENQPNSNRHSNSREEKLSPPPVADALRGFDKFWEVYPRRHGKIVGKAPTAERWKKLPLEDKRAAYRGAMNYALACNADLTLAKDPDRWIRDRCWVDWQDPATPSTNGHQYRPPAAVPVRETESPDAYVHNPAPMPANLRALIPKEERDA